MTGNVPLGGFQLDTDGRLLSSAATCTAVSSTAAVDLDPINTPWVGPNPADTKLAVAYSYDNTNATTYVVNQISSYVESNHNTYGVPIWGVGNAIHSNSFAWGVAGVAGAYNTAAGAFGAEFNIAVQSATPAVFTNAWALSLASGGDAQSTPTGFMYVAANAAGNAVKNVFVIRDEAWTPVISTGNVMVTGFTAGLGGAKHLSCANGINFLNTTFSGYAFCYGTGTTPLFSVDGTGNIAGAKLSISKATASIDLTSTTGTNRCFTSMSNTGGNFNFGMESSAGGSLFAGSLPYAAVSGATGGVAYQLATNNAIRATITSAGDMGIGTATPATKLDVDGLIKPKSYTVAGLPAGVVGATAYASNGRKVGEGAGSGTGVPVYYSNGSWRVYSTDAAVAA